MIVQVVITNSSDNDVAAAGIVPFKSLPEAMTFAVKVAEINDPETMAQARKDVRDDNGTCDIYELLEMFNDFSGFTIRVVTGWNTASYLMLQPPKHGDIETEDHPIPFSDIK